MEFSAIEAKVNPETGEVTLSYGDKFASVVVTGESLKHAKYKLQEAYTLGIVHFATSVPLEWKDPRLEEAYNNRQRLIHTLRVSL